jgi:hypothetical protein
MENREAARYAERGLTALFSLPARTRNCLQGEQLWSFSDMDWGRRFPTKFELIHQLCRDGPDERQRVTLHAGCCRARPAEPAQGFHAGEAEDDLLG